MKLVEYEVLIKKQVAEDLNNPEIYNNLQRMILMFLQRKKVCHCLKDYEDMSYLLAGDVYMKILGGEKIGYFLGYLEKVYRKYAQQYYKDHSSEFIYYDDSDDFADTVFNQFSHYDYDCVNNKIYLEKIWKVIDQVMASSCKYDRMSRAYLNLRLSLVLSLLRGRETCFHLEPDQKFYLKFIMTNFCSIIKKEAISE